MTEIWFIRHGETEWNRTHRLQGWRDTPLNSAGQSQAEKLAERMVIDAQRTPFDAIYASDLQRARQTADATATRLNMAVHTEPGIRERGYGVLEGLNRGELERDQPEQYAAWKSREPVRALNGGESLGEFQRRVLTAVDSIVSKHPDERLLVFTHGGVLDILWRRALDLPLDAHRRDPVLNVSVNRIGIADTGWTLLSWGDVAHVKDETADDFSAR